jgi:hypothetical protein
MGKTKTILIAGIFVCLAAIGLWFVLSHKSAEKPAETTKKSADETPPTVSIDSGGLQPAGGLSGIVTVTVHSHDNVSVNKIEYYVDGTFFAVTYAAPFSLHLDTSRLTAGDHKLVARAYDAAGNHASSQAVTITIADKSTSVPSEDKTVGTAKPTPKSSGSSSSSASSPGNSSSSDTAAPSAPSNLTLSASNAYAVGATWSASTDNVGISGYKVFRDGVVLGTTTTTSYKDYTVVPGNEYAYSVQAYDAAGNTADSTQPVITLGTTSIWDGFDQPETFSNDGVPLELGVKFKPKVNGKITGVRFYKASGDTGTHVGRLWTAGGSPLANATFSGESASGWQQVTFSTPVDVTANTTYVVSYTTPQGRYGTTGSYFSTAGITNEYLSSPKSGGADGLNGVYNTTGGSFPTSSFNQTNYWVDVAFTPNLNAGGPSPTLADSSQTFTGYPGSDNTGVVGLRLPRRDRVDPLNGMTISGVEIDSDFVAVKNNNVTFDHVKIKYTGPLGGSFTIVNIQVGVTGTTFLDSEVDGQGATERAIYGVTEVVVRRSNIHGTANGIEVSNRITATDNYIHDIFTPSGQIWHADGIQTASSANDLTITHNTIFLTSSETGAVNFVGSSPGSGDFLTDVLVDNNLMAGGSYTVYVGADINTNVRVTNNKFSTRYYPKVGNFNIYYPTFLSGVTVSGNTIYETGAAADVNLP